MSRQIEFFVLPDELIELEGFIKNEMEGLFIFRSSTISDIVIANDVLNIPYQNAYITPRFELKNITLEKTKSGLFMISSFAPIIVFSQSLIKEGALRSARLLYRTGCYRGDDWVDFSKEYVSWCENVFKWIKKKYKPCAEPKGYRISTSVLNMVNNGELKLSKI